MKVFESASAIQNLCWKRGFSLGFVPTMGALHAGHKKLIEHAVTDNQKTLVSIFVNPTQFNSKEDFDHYPTNLDQDLELCQKAGADYIYLPRQEEIYADGYQFEVQEKTLSRILCGESRPGHFEGVMTVVLKFLNMTQADFAYFGEKDFQQYVLIKNMAKAFMLPTQIIGIPTVREADGLAMSSRNIRLSSQARALAVKIYQNLKAPISLEVMRANLEALGFTIDYLQDYEGRRFIAAVLENIRLIDNVELS